MNRRMVLTAAGTMLWAIAVVGSSLAETQQEKTSRAVVVFAAVSTGNAVDDIRREFTKQTGIEVQTSYASSATLAQQISPRGAEADVFLSADKQWTDFLTKKNLVARQKDLLTNRLVTVIPADSPLKLAKLADLREAGIEHLALGDPEGTPLGRYAKQALQKLGLWESLKAKIVPASDARQALTYVETEAAQAGIVYATDAALSKKVKVALEIPADLTGPICYSLALLKAGANEASARQFYDRLLSPSAAKTFRRYGFVVR